MNSTTASIISEYLDAGTFILPGKKVDFCLHIDPAADGREATRRIDQLRDNCPALCINHTDFAPLASRPVAVSIESKRRDAKQQASEARLQVSVWQAAQWNMLATLLGSDSSRRQGHGQLPSFLPAVIIDGHDWALIATTKEDRRTVLWAEAPFGSTRDVLGVYKIVYGLQVLATWSRLTFWPWYKQEVLGISTPDKE